MIKSLGKRPRGTMIKDHLVFETSQGSFLVRPYQPGDEKMILPAWQAAFGKKMSLEHWCWKYPENPAGFRCLLCIAEDGTVAAHYAAQVMKINFFGEEISGLHLTDSFSHPRFRWALGGKTGLFVKTAWAFLSTYLDKIDLPQLLPLGTDLPRAQFHYGFPGERHFRLGIKLLAYRFHGPGMLYFQTSQTTSPRRLFQQRLEVSSASDFRNWELFDELLSRLPLKKFFCILRNSAFMRWRFGSKLNNNYLIIYSKTFWRKKVKAWIILDKKFRILDFLAEKEDELLALLGVLKEVAKEINPENKNARFEVWLAGNHPLKRAFVRAGFVPEKEPLGIVPNTRCDMDRKDVHFKDADLFFFTMADADLF